jgi:hypothetical protein
MAHEPGIKAWAETGGWPEGSTVQRSRIVLSRAIRAFGLGEAATMMEDEDKGLAIKVLMMIVGALFIVMTSIGGFTAAHIISQADDTQARLTGIQAQLAAEDVVRKDFELRLVRIENLLDDARRKLFEDEQRSGRR